MGNKYVFKDHQEKLAERSATLEMPNGEVFTILPPPLWPDEVSKVAATDPIAAASEILEGGAEAYARYTAAGGNAMTLADIVEQEFGATVPE